MSAGIKESNSSYWAGPSKCKKSPEQKTPTKTHAHTICKLWILCKQIAEWVHQRTGLRGEPLGIRPSYCIKSYAMPIRTHNSQMRTWKSNGRIMCWLLGRQTQLTTRKSKAKQTQAIRKRIQKIDFSSFWRLPNKQRRFHYFWWTLCLLADCDCDWLTKCPSPQKLIGTVVKNRNF